MDTDERISWNEQLQAANEWMEDSPFEVLDDVTPTADGCEVEPDGICPHGYESFLLILGII